MSDDDRFFTRRDPNVRLGKESEGEYQVKVKFLEMGEEKTMSPIDLEFKEIWDNESNKVILIELFHQTLDHNELLQNYTRIMSNLQEKRAMEAARQGIDPERVMRSEEFTRFNPHTAESFLYKSLNILRSNGLIDKVAHVISTKNIYYSLIPDGSKKVVEWLSTKYFSHAIFFITLLKYYTTMNEKSVKSQPIQNYPISTPYLLMKWMKNFTRIDPLLTCMINETTIETIQQLYTDYLVVIENQDISILTQPLEIKRIKKEIYEKISNLGKRGLIVSNRENQTIGMSERGTEQFSNIYSAFQKSITDIYMDHLITIHFDPNNDELLMSSISLTNNGKIIAEYIQKIRSNDENLITSSEKDDTVIPLQDEMERLQLIKEQYKVMRLVIPKKSYGGLKHEIQNKISHPMSVAFIFTIGMILIMYSIISQFSDSLGFILGLVCIFLTPFLALYKRHLMMPDMMLEHENEMKRRLL